MHRPLEGDAVVDRDGAPLGTIAELLLDVEYGVVAYALIASPADGSLRAVPWKDLRWEDAAAPDPIPEATALPHP